MAMPSRVLNATSDPLSRPQHEQPQDDKGPELDSSPSRTFGRPFIRTLATQKKLTPYFQYSHSGVVALDIHP
jgi:hypothetical protein